MAAKCGAMSSADDGGWGFATRPLAPSRILTRISGANANRLLWRLLKDSEVVIILYNCLVRATSADCRNNF